MYDVQIFVCIDSMLKWYFRCKIKVKLILMWLLNNLSYTRDLCVRLAGYFDTMYDVMLHSTGLIRHRHSAQFLDASVENWQEAPFEVVLGQGFGRWPEVGHVLARSPARSGQAEAAARGGEPKSWRQHHLKHFPSHIWAVFGRVSIFIVIYHSWGFC